MALTPQQKADLLALMAANGLSGTESFAAANALNRPVVSGGGPTRRKLAISEIQGALLRGGNMSVIVDAQDSVTPGTKSAARTCLEIFRQTQVAEVDTQTGEIGFLDAIQTAGLISAGRLAAIKSLADTTAPLVNGPSLFATAFPGFLAVVQGVTYRERCHSEIVLEARL